MENSNVEMTSCYASSPTFAGRIRPIQTTDDTEIEWAAAGMRQTLIEVEGEAVGAALYST